MPLMRLALITVHTSPLAKLGGSKTGGMNVYVREIALELSKRNIAVDIYTRREATETPLIDNSLADNIRVVHISAGPEQALSPDEVYPYLTQFTAGVLALITNERIQYDVIYSHYWLSGLVAHVLEESLGTPFVQMFHTLGHMKNRIVMSGLPPLAPNVRVHSEIKIVRWASRIVAATVAEQSQLLWLYRADRRKIAIIPPGVNAERFYPLPMAQTKHQLGIAIDSHLILFVGRIEPLKGVENILHALYLLHQQTPQMLSNVCFAVVGGDLEHADRELTRLRQLSVQLGLSQYVRFLGAQDHSMLPVYYSAALVVMMPSDYESFGLAALEAMACGTPVIASQVGGLAYLIKDGETGFLVPVRQPEILAERISFLISNPHKREQMGRAAARLAQQYTWPSVVDQLLSMFETVAERRFNRRRNSAHLLP